MKTSKGQTIILDAADEAAMAGQKWCVSAYGYAVRRVQGRIVYMHRELLGLVPGDGKLVDHKDGDRLNNSRSNLRIATCTQNQHNRKLRVDSASGIKGVYKVPGRDKWKAYILRGYKKCNLGTFARPELAREFRELAAEMLHGEFVNHARK
jgi:hypothetical protein